MPKYFLLGFFLFTITIAGAQNTGVIKGRVIDSLSNKPVEMATVVVSDSRDTSASFISYTLTDKNGNFTLHKLPGAIPLKVLISYVAYQPSRRRMTLRNNQTAELGNILLSPKELEEIVIKGERVPVVFKKDTIEFNAEAFPTRPNAVVEELLKKLPGVEIDNTGKITVLGKDVSKVQVDGRDFFTNDIRIATRNLDADLISKIQVYDDRENDPNHLIPDNNVKKIINLKFKKALKKSVFGKVSGGKGTNDQYEASGLVNMFRDTLQVSVLSNTNNLNNTGFDFNDLMTMGGVGRGGAEAFGSAGFIGGPPAGKQVSRSGGVNINTDYGKKLKMNLAYTIGSTNNQTRTVTNRQQLLNDTTFVTNTVNSRNSSGTSHGLSGTVTWQPNGTPATYIRYSPYLRLTNNNSTSDNTSFSFSNFNNRINNSVSATNSNGSSKQFRHSLTFSKQFTKKPGMSLGLDHSLSISPNNSHNVDDQALNSYLAGLQSYSFSREGVNTNRATSVTNTVTFRYPFTKKLALDVRLNADYSNNLDRVATFDYNPATGAYDTFLPIQSSDLTRKISTTGLQTGSSYNFANQLSISARVLLRSMLVHDSFGRGSGDLQHKYFNALPSVSLNYKAFSLSYDRSMTLPNIGDMIPYSVVFSPIYSVTGNPSLKPTNRNSFSVAYRKYDFQKRTNLSVGFNFSHEENSIFRQRTLSKELVETSTPINRNGRYDYRAAGGFSKQFKPNESLQWSINSSADFNFSRDFYVINQKEGFQNGYSANVGESVSIYWKNIITFQSSYGLGWIHTGYSGVNSVNQQTYITHSAFNRLTLAWPRRFYIDGSYSYRYNPLLANGFQKSSNLLNLSVARQFLKKDKGEIKLSCYDILNQNVSVFRSINANTITDTEQQTIKRYFMLTLLFKFNKSTTTK